MKYSTLFLPKLTFSTDVKLGGSAVPAGSYALFTIPGEAEWTVILSKVVADQWGKGARFGTGVGPAWKR